VCYTEGVPSVTSSFRMSKELQRDLSDAAERTGKGKNAIIIEALCKSPACDGKRIACRGGATSIRACFQERADADWYGLADPAGWR